MSLPLREWAQGTAKWEVSSVQEGKCVLVGEGLLGIETKGKLLPTQATRALQRLVCCVVWW